MASVNDEKFRALRGLGHTGAMPDMLLQWLQAGGATSPNLTDAWREYLDILTFTTGNRNDDWFAYLETQVTPGALNDMELQFWSSLGNLGPEMVTDPGFDNPGDWTAGFGWTVQNSRAEALAATGTVSQAIIGLVEGTTYRVSHKASDDGGGVWRVDLTGGVDGPGTARSANGDYSEDIVAGAGNTGVTVFASGAPTVNIDDLSIKEVL